MDIFCFVPQTKCISLYILTKSGILSALIEFVFFFFPTESFQVIVQTVHTHTHKIWLKMGRVVSSSVPPHQPSSHLAPFCFFFLVPSDPVLRYEAVKCPNVAAIFFLKLLVQGWTSCQIPLDQLELLLPSPRKWQGIALRIEKKGNQRNK